MNGLGGHWIRTDRRWAIYVRDGFACCWCGDVWPDLTLDHLFPPGRWRDNHPRRLVTACRACNGRRQGRGVAAWLRLLRAEGVDLDPVIQRLRRARLPVDRAAGVAARAELRAPLPPLPEGLPGVGVDGVLY